MVRPVEITVALVDTVFEPRLMQVRVLPPEVPYPHWLVPAAEAVWEEVYPSKLAATTVTGTISLAKLWNIPGTLFDPPVVTRDSTQIVRPFLLRYPLGGDHERFQTVSWPGHDPKRVGYKPGLPQPSF
jgi:hypothetical protein